MAFAVNELINEALEDVNLLGSGETAEGDMAASAEGCLNRAIRELNGDGYVSLTQHSFDINAAGPIYFRKLEPGETKPNTIDMEPPDSVDNVARTIGMRYVRLRPASRDVLDRTRTYSFPTMWSYGVDSEIAPSGTPRQVGIVYVNGSYPTDCRLYVMSQLPKYRLGDTIYLSSLYRNLILYATELKLVELKKLYSYKEDVKRNLGIAMKQIDTKHLNNEPATPDYGESQGVTAADLLAGYGF